jgi:transaldolase
MDVPGFARLLKRKNVESEVWWDSSPTDYMPFKHHMMSKYPDMLDVIESVLPPNFVTKHTGITGATTNPRLIARAVIEHPAHWHDRIDSLDPFLSSADKARRLYDQVIVEGAKALHPLWLSSLHRHGWLSAQIDGGERMDASALVARGLQLASLAPNIMVKVPGSEAGYRAIERLVAKGCSINNTFCFTVSQVAACLKAIHNGRLRARTQGVSTEQAVYVISFMIGRLGAEGAFGHQASQQHLTLTAEDKRWAEIAVYQAMQALLRRWQTPARLLLCSLKIDVDARGREQCWHLQRTGAGPTLYTLTPQIFEFLIRRQQQKRPVVPATDWVRLPKDLQARLSQIPYFSQAYFEGGLAPSGFAGHPPFLTASHDAAQGQARLSAFLEAASIAPALLTKKAPTQRPGERAL